VFVFVTPSTTPPRAVLFDRDGTLIVNVPYNGDPGQVVLMRGAQAAVGRLRELGIRVGVVTNQSGIGRGLLTRAEVDRVNARVDRLLGPFDVWRLCPHTQTAGCGCRKPAPGMVYSAAAELGVPTQRVALIGDISSDIAAATAAGAQAVLVPTPATQPADLTTAAAIAAIAADLVAAVELLVGPASAAAPLPGAVMSPGVACGDSQAALE